MTKYLDLSQRNWPKRLALRNVGDIITPGIPISETQCPTQQSRIQCEKHRYGKRIYIICGTFYLFLIKTRCGDTWGLVPAFQFPPKSLILSFKKSQALATSKNLYMTSRLAYSTVQLSHSCGLFGPMLTADTNTPPTRLSSKSSVDYFIIITCAT